MACIAEIGLPQPETKMIEMTSAYFSFEPILSSLKLMPDVPLRDDLILQNDGQAPAHPKHYLSNIGYRTIVDAIDQNAGNDVSHLLGVEKIFQTGLTLDDSQHDALMMCLKNRVALIQGPPGTGKSFVGALAAKCLYDTTQEIILCVCYTNHALDQFLEHAIKIGVDPNHVIRLGSGKKATKVIEPLMLHSIMKRERPPFDKSQKVVYGQSMSRMEELNWQVRDEVINLESQISWDQYQDLLIDEFDGELPSEFQMKKSQDGFATVGKKNKHLSPSEIWKIWKSGSSPPPGVEDPNGQLWRLSTSERQRLLAMWTHRIRNRPWRRSWAMQSRTIASRTPSRS